MSRFDSRAWAEVEEAAQWYEDRVPGYGDRLFNAVEATVKDVEEFPRKGARFEHGMLASEIRRALVPGFPYSLFYELEPDLVFLAFAHVARSPGYWIDRLG